MACIENLDQPLENWKPMGVPLCSLMNIEERHGKAKPVIRKYLVDLEGPVYQSFLQQRESWKLNDDYQTPGPIQFFGPREVSEEITTTLRLARSQTKKCSSCCGKCK